MSTTMPEETLHTLSITRSALIKAPIEIAFEAALEEMGPEGQMPGGQPFAMKLEPWPGGRWFRDLGPFKGFEGTSGHLWGHVQVIKPPKLLEIRGPLFMSYPAVNFVRYRFTEEEGGTRFELSHQAFGLIPADHREGVNEGWDYTLERVAEISARLLKSGKKGS